MDSGGTRVVELPTDVSFSEVCDGLRDLPPRDRVAAIERYRRRLDAMEAETLAGGVVGPPHIKGGARNAFRIAEAAGVSTAEQRRRVNRARMVAENPQIAGRMAGGHLGAEQVDSIARASRRTDGAAARSPELLDRLTEAEPRRRCLGGRAPDGRPGPDRTRPPARPPSCTQGPDARGPGLHHDLGRRRVNRYGVAKD